MWEKWKNPRPEMRGATEEKKKEVVKRFQAGKVNWHEKRIAADVMGLVLNDQGSRGGEEQLTWESLGELIDYVTKVRLEKEAPGSEEVDPIMVMLCIAEQSRKALEEKIEWARKWEGEDQVRIQLEEDPLWEINSLAVMGFEWYGELGQKNQPRGKINGKAEIRKVKHLGVEDWWDYSS